jgi:DNA polymerase elongation subunit (family B)
MRYYTNVTVGGAYGSALLYRGIQDGRRVRLKIPYKPTLYLPSPTPTEYTNLQGQHLAPLHFDSINDARKHLKQYKDVAGFQTYGMTNYEYAFIAEEHPEDAIQWKLEDIVVAYLDIEVGSANGFPSPSDATQPITAITVKLSNGPQYHVFGYGAYQPHRPDVNWRLCMNEQDMLKQFLTFWEEQAPDIISGWNVKTFDIPYLVNRLTNLWDMETGNRLSPWGTLMGKTEKFYGKEIHYYELVGISTLDYLQLFRKYAPNHSQESYKLGDIAFVELKETKLSYDEYDSLQDLYLKNYQKFIEYNVRDVELVVKLNDKSRLVDMAIVLAYDNKTNFDDVFTQVRMWDCICYNHLLKKKIIVPPKQDHTKTNAYEGAFVKPPQVGKHRCVGSYDLDSLYPHLIMQYNLSPEMLVDQREQTPVMKSILQGPMGVDALLARQVDLSQLAGHTMTPNGQFFRTDRQGFLAEIMETKYRDRVIYKTKQLDAQKEKESCHDPVRLKELSYLISRYKILQLAKKTSLNSAYGAMGNEYFRFFDIRIAEGVTLAGQLSIRWIERALNDYLNRVLKTKEADYILAMDTDSVYVNFGPLADKVFPTPPPIPQLIDWMDQVTKTIREKVIVPGYQDLAVYVHAFAQKMSMKRESLCDTAIWTAKKRYLLNVYDEEGIRYAEPKLKITGLEAIKSSTPSACRKKIKDALKIIMNGTEAEAQAFIAEFRDAFSSLPIEEIAFPRTVNGTEEDGYGQATLSGLQDLMGADPGVSYKLGAPIHVKGALVYNYYLEKLDLLDHYEPIREGDKLKFIHLKEPNAFRSPVIAFLTRCPKEFKLHTCIDYNKQFEKSFVDPLKIVLDVIGWQVEPQTSLEDFFS